MNNLYKELYIKAADFCIKECTKDEVNQAWIWERKYAELIVKECLACLHWDERENILKRFGMED